MKIRDSARKNPKALLQTYVVGSLIVLSSCLGLAAICLSWMFTNQEHRRAELSLTQVNSFMEFQYRPIAEEMWTESYESIGMRIKDIARQLGDARYELYLTDPAGVCKYAASSDLSVGNTFCALPTEFSQEISFSNHSSDPKPTLRVNSETGQYSYFAPIYVGTVLKGYMLTTFSDPYNFFRGSLFSVAAKFFLPTMAVVFLIWILWSYVARSLILKPYFEAIVELQKQEALADMATQVAHDIRSPLSALNMVIPILGNVPEEAKALLINAVNRISDIANGLIRVQKVPSPLSTNVPMKDTANDSEVAPLMLVSFIESLVSEKRMQYRDAIGISIYTDTQRGYGQFVRVNPKELIRVISNLVNNAIEAIPNSGSVKISLDNTRDEVSISVTDNGVGIPDNIISKIGKKGFSFGKGSSPNSGSGLGLYYANNFLTEVNGSLSITSKIGAGTTVQLNIPKVSPPSWFVDQLIVPRSTVIVTLDDDQTIHQLWNGRFLAELGADIAEKHQMFSNVYSFKSWLEVAKPTSKLFLIDFDLQNLELNGLECIQNLGIANNSYLVTSRYEDPIVIHNACEAGVKIIPKGLLGAIPLRMAD